MSSNIQGDDEDERQPLLSAGDEAQKNVQEDKKHCSLYGSTASPREGDPDEESNTSHLVAKQPSANPTSASASPATAAAAATSTITKAPTEQDQHQDEGKEPKTNEAGGGGGKSEAKGGDGDDDDDEESKPSLKYALTPEELAAKRLFWLVVNCISYVVLLVSWIVVLTTKAVSLDFTVQVPAGVPPVNMTNESDWSPTYITAYNVKAGVADLFIVDCIRAIPMIVFFFLLRARPDWLHPYTFHYTLFFWFVVTAKAWAFGGWDCVVSVPMWISLVTSTTNVFAHNQIYNCDVPPSFILTFSGVKQVMGPYIAPSGTWNRAVVFSMWAVVAASKASVLVSPIVLGNAVSYISDRDLHNAAMQLIIYGVLQLVPQVLESAQDTVSSYVWMAAYREVAENAFSHVLHLDLHWHLTKKLGKVMRSIDRGMNAAERLMSWIAMWALPNVGTGVLSFVVFVAHFQQPELAAICWLSLCLYIWVTVLITKVRRRYNEKENVHDNDAHDNSTDALINIEVVKAFTNEKMEIKNYVESVRRMQTFNYKGQMFTALVNMSQGSVIQICTVSTLILAAIHTVHNTAPNVAVEVATFVAISQYLNNLFSPLGFIGSLYSMTITALVDVQNLAEILDEVPELKDRPDAIDFRSKFPQVCAGSDKGGPGKECEGISVEFDDVYFHYPTQDADKGLQGVSFKMEPGTTTAICGQTGSGKTTVGSKLLFGFFEPQKGSIKFNGIDSKVFTAGSLRREIGIVPQDTVLFNNSLKYNVAYGRMDATDDEIDEAVRVAQLPPTLERLSHGLMTVVGERGARLSGGERQRVAIARCVLKNPSIMVFDEATSAVDSTTERHLQDSLDILAHGRRTSLVIAHRLTTIQNADQIIVMDKGRIIERGKHDELLALKGQYYGMWNAQKKAVEEDAVQKQQKQQQQQPSDAAAPSSKADEKK